MVFLLVISPILFVLLVWTAVTVFRLAHPDEPRNPIADNGYFDLPEDPVSEPVLMGARSIRDQGRRQNRQASLSSPYDFLDGHSDGFPEAWWEDVLQRRN